MSTPASLVLEFSSPTPQQSCDFMYAKLCYHADCADVAEDLLNRVDEIVVIDTRAEAWYDVEHIPGAISFPHRSMSAQSVAALDPTKTYVTYCDGIGCNGSTKGAHKLAKLGFKVKELLGGLDFWKRNGLRVATGSEPGQLSGDAQAIACSC